MVDLTSYKKYQIVEIVQETEKAWLILLEDGRKQWFAKSQCRVEGWHLYAPDWIFKGE